MTELESLVDRCVQLAASKDDAAAELDKLFGRPGALAGANYFRPMLKAFFEAATADRAWTCLSPLVRRWMAEPHNPDFVHYHSVVKYVLDLYATFEDKDPRWLALAIDAMANDRIYDETFMAVLEGQPLPVDKVDALLEGGSPPRPLLRVLAARQDARVRPLLETLLRDAPLAGYGVLVYAGSLRALPDHDEALIEVELAKRFAARRDYDNKLDGGLADALIECLADVSPMVSEQAYDLAWQHLSEATVAAEDWDDDDRLKRDLLQRLEALRPESLAGGWSRTLTIQRLPDYEDIPEIGEAAARAFFETDGAYELTLSDGMLTVCLGADYGRLFWSQSENYHEAISPAPPAEDQTLPGLAGDETEPVGPEACIPRPTAVELAIAACASNSAGAIDIEWLTFQ